MHPVPTRQQLLQAIAALPDDWLEEALQLITTLQERATQATPSPDHNTQTILERMGGMPRFLVHNGQLSDRDSRRKILREKIQRRYGQSTSLASSK